MTKQYNDRISYSSQPSGEYFIFVDGEFYCSSDNYKECMEDIEYLLKDFEAAENKNVKISGSISLDESLLHKQFSIEVPKEDLSDEDKIRNHILNYINFKYDYSVD